MQIFFPKEEAHEIRATILPEVAKKFIDLGIEVSVESGLGDNVFVLMNYTSNLELPYAVVLKKVFKALM